MPALFFWQIGIVVFVGLVLGSFATALAWRVPRGISWVFGDRDHQGFARSLCPRCSAALSFFDLIPVFSWVVLKGKCRRCGAPIGWRYPAIELLTLALCLGIFGVWGWSVPAFILMAAMPFLAALLFIDMEVMILPNHLVLVVGGLGAVFWGYRGFFGDFSAIYGRDVLGHVVGAVLFASVAWSVRWAVGRALKKEAMGLGDVKFFAVSGLWLGPAFLPFFLICSGAAGVVWGLLSRIVLKKQVFPFGPALILSLYAGLLFLGLDRG